MIAQLPKNGNPRYSRRDSCAKR